MIVTTTDYGLDVDTYYGIVSGQAVAGVNIIKDVFAKVNDVIGGNSGVYEREWARAHERATAKLVQDAAQRFPGADAVVGVGYASSVVGEHGSILAVVASGTAVKLAGSKRSGSSRSSSRKHGGGGARAAGTQPATVKPAKPDAKK